MSHICIISSFILREGRLEGLMFYISLLHIFHVAKNTIIQITYIYIDI